jgi:serine/threonine protein kinase/tetratricopeptide (TPR) repeat protein
MANEGHSDIGRARDASDVLEELVIECLERIESDGEAALEAVCERHPAHAAELRSRMSALRSAGLLTPPSSAEASAFPERLGDFRLLARLGGGGMGVVYLARQESLGREVALKLIRPEHLYFPGARERFRREVETVARLAHPGIVPIYTVGEEHGIPFFAMERVEGCTLADIVDQVHAQFVSTLDGADLDRAIAARTGDGEQRSPAAMFAGRWVEACVRVVREAAEALEHVHRRGVLHRDVKPSNVMLTRGGRVMLVDFGLSSAQGVDRLTRSGSQLGSLPYMAPEQVRGDVGGIDARSDVYSLAVTLYELLTLRMPFADEQMSELRRKIAEGRPPSIRELNSAVEWDVETVCLHAMESDPARRYASAADFAHDLTNVLERRPIVARRASAALRARRWVQRHPATTVALVLGGALLVGGPSVYAWQQHRTNLAIAAKNTEIEAKNVALGAAVDQERELRTESDLQRIRAERNFGAALEAVQTMLSQVGGEELKDVPEMEETRRALLAKALAFYQHFLEQKGDTSVLRVDIAHTLRYMGDALADLDRREEAEQAYRDAIASFDEMHQREPDDARHADALANTHVMLGRMMLQGARFDEASRSLDEAIALLNDLILTEGDDKYRIDLAGALMTRAQVATQTGVIAQAEQQFQAALDVCAAMHADEAQPSESRRMQGDLWIALGTLRFNDKRVEAAQQCYEQALALRKLEYGFDHKSRALRMHMAEVLSDLGMSHASDADPAVAEESYRRAIDMQSELVRDFPRIANYREALATVRANLALLTFQRHGPTPEAERLYSDAVEALEPLVAERAEIPDYKCELASAVAGLSTVERDQGRLVESAASSERALELMRAAHVLKPNHVAYIEQLKVDALIACDVHAALGEHIETVARAREARSFAAGDWLTLGRVATRIAKCIPLVYADPALDSEQRDHLAAQYATESLDALRASVESGCKQWTELAASRSLDSVRDDPRFAEIAALARSKAQ